MRKKDVVEFLQEAINLAEEIDWTDKRINTFKEDFAKEYGELYKTLLAINGFQAWEGEE